MGNSSKMGNALDRCCKPEVSDDMEIYNSERNYSSGIKKDISVNEIEKPKYGPDSNRGNNNDEYLL